MLMRLLADHLTWSHVFCTKSMGDADQFRQEPSPATRTAMLGDRPVDGGFLCGMTVLYSTTDIHL
jgi:hypothetical protein